MAENEVEALKHQVEELRSQLEALSEHVQELRDIEAIKQLKARYVRYVDTQDWDAWASEVLTDDFHHESVGQVLDGRAKAVASIAASLRGGTTTHHCHTPEITITGPDTATGIWALQDVSKVPGDGSPIVFHGDGHYYEEYVRTEDGWRLKSNVVNFVAVDPMEGT